MGLLGSIIKAVVTTNVVQNVANTAMAGFGAAISKATEKTKRKKLETESKIQELLITKKITRITMLHSFRYYKGKNYKEVEKELLSYGFEKVKCVGYKQSIFRNNNVYRVTIGGKIEFQKKDVFYSNEKVVILYYQ